MKKSERLAIRLSPETRSALKEEAERQDRSEAAVARRLIETGLRKPKRGGAQKGKP